MVQAAAVIMKTAATRRWRDAVSRLFSPLMSPVVSLIFIVEGILGTARVRTVIEQTNDV
jgi:hypothetical protein